MIRREIGHVHGITVVVFLDFTICLFMRLCCISAYSAAKVDKCLSYSKN